MATINLWLQTQKRFSSHDLDGYGHRTNDAQGALKRALPTLERERQASQHSTAQQLRQTEEDQMAAPSPLTAYLEFVRNLTPQIVFGTCYMLLRLRIDTDKLQLDWEGLKNAGAIWSCAFLFFGAILANMKRLLDSISTSSEPLEIELMRIRSRQLALGRATLEVLRAGWRLNKLGFLQFIIVVAVAYGGLYVVIEMATQGALAALKNTVK